MKLKMPSNCKGLNLTDKEKVFANLMLQIVWADGSRDWPTTEYRFYKRDVGKLIAAQSYRTTNLKDAFVFGDLNDATTSVRFINPSKNSLHTCNHYEDTISELIAIKLHMFILGRFMDPRNIFNEETGLYTGWHYSANPYVSAYITSK